MPIGATLVSEHVAEAFDADAGADGVFAHGHTYGGHPVACAVARENIRIMLDEGLAERAERMGAKLRSELSRLAEHPTVIDVRGVGMLNGLEVVRDDTEAGRFGTAQQAASWLRKYCCKLGLVTLTVHPGTVLLLAPPLVIDEREIDVLVSIFDRSLTELEARR
jgi:4-aminobutyrate--pyruvate transaminase